MFGDEVGTDTNHMEDSNNWGQRYISVNGTRTNLLSSKDSSFFTLMGLTDATSDPVLCICILAAKILSFTDVKGFDNRISIPYDSIKTIEENMGECKALPNFPVCNFRGKFIPGLMCTSPKWSISSKILTEALKYLYEINVFERRQDGSTPLRLFHGHGIRLQLPFL